MSPREEENRRTWALGEPRRADRGLRRADRGLRVFGERIGHAVMCVRCNGDGTIVGREMHWPNGRGLSTGRLIDAPVKCPICNGEGLDPNARQGEEG